MASINLSGVLRNPDTTLASGGEIRLIHRSNTGEVVAGFRETKKVNNDGTYDFNIQYGNVFIQTRDVGVNQWTDHGTLTINQDTTATTLPELLNAVIPPTDSQLLQFQSLLADAVTARDEAATSASEAEASALFLSDKDVANKTENPLTNLDLTQDSTGSAEGFWKFGSLNGSFKWAGGALAPNGKIYGIPYGSTQALEIDPINQTTTLFGSLSGGFKWFGGVLAPNGKIYGIPYGSTQVLEIDPINQTTTLFGNLSGSAKWRGGVLAPNGKIYGIPASSEQVLEIDPINQTTTLFGNLSGSDKWYGGVLAPNGKIYGIPAISTQVLEISKGSCGGNYWSLSAYTNKF